MVANNNIPEATDEERMQVLIDQLSAYIEQYHGGSVEMVDFDGEVVKRVSEQRAGHIDHFDYFWPIWRT